MSDSISRSWFAVFNNPEKHGYIGEPEEIIERMKKEWIGNNSLKKGYWAYCISEKGLPHIHMILEGSGSMRFSAVKKAYPKAHLEPTKGNRAQVLAYMKKEAPFDEKGEEVICSIMHGDIEGNKKTEIRTSYDALKTIEQLIEEGYIPNQIMDEDIRLRKEEGLIRKAYFAKRYKETPPKRDVKVYWHLGNSGDGKSYSYVLLCEEKGDDNVYLFTDYANRGVGGFDGYCGEEILFMDELKKSSLPFDLLLTLMQGYRTQLHCRYANSYALWSEVHITSIYSPEEIYSSLVDRIERDRDPIYQLLRRISVFVYHYKEDGQYKQFELEGESYTNYYNLKALARGKDGFIKVKDGENPFE